MVAVKAFRSVTKPNRYFYLVFLLDGYDDVTPKYIIERPVKITDDDAVMDYWFIEFVVHALRSTGIEFEDTGKWLQKWLV